MAGKRKYLRVREGSVDLRVPPAQKISREMPVFFNPSKRLDRDMSVLFLKAFRKIAEQDLEVCDLLAASGVRGLRYACEVEGLESVLMNDANPIAYALMRKNLKLNEGKIKCEVETSKCDANRLLHNLRRKFTVIDVDPYGPPNPFLASSVLSLKRRGILAVTSTDTAPLCGSVPRACLRKYGALPHMTEYYGEESVRILAKKVIEVGAQFGVALTPIFSYFLGSYAKVFLRSDLGAKRVDGLMKRLGFILHCDSCLMRSTISYGEMEDAACPLCGSKRAVIGPLFLGRLWDESICKDMRVMADGEAKTLLASILEELRLGTVAHYTTDSLSHALRRREPRMEDLFDAIKSRNRRVCRTHFSLKGFRTDIEHGELIELFKRL